MTQDVIFRSAAIGGFNKEDVLEYISEQKDVITALERKTEVLESKYAQCDRDRADAVSERAAIGEELNNVRSRIDELTAELSEKNERINSLTQELSRMSEAAAELENCRSLLNDEQNEKRAEENDSRRMYSQEIMNRLNEKDSEIAELKRVNRELSEKIEKLNADSRQIGALTLNAETTVGNAILDARRFSDTIIKEAQDKVTEMSNRSRIASDATKARVKDVTLSIKAFAERFNSILDEIYSDASVIDCDMDVFNDYFNQAKHEINNYVSPIDRDKKNV